MSLLLLFGAAAVPVTPDPVETTGTLAPPTGQSADVTVWLQALDGTWENCGSERAVGVVPESLTAESDPWGVKIASFDLRRAPFALWPDVAAFAPCMIEIAGQIVWRGRTGETPIRDGADFVINVQCEGSQARLDDDSYHRVYVHSTLTDWKDARSFVTSDLTRCRTNGSVQAGDGVAVIGFGSGASVTTGDAVGVILDLGVNQSARRVVVEWQNKGVVAGSYGLFVKGLDSPANIVTGGENAYSVDPGSGASPAAGTTANAHRYFAILLYRTGGAVTETADRLLRITAARIFTDTAYESGNVSALKASAVFGDALDRATMLLSPDRSGIQATTFNIPDLAPDEERTPREMAEGVNAFHNWVLKIDQHDRPIFKPRPTAPLLEIGNWQGASLVDAAANSGAEIYDRCIVRGVGADDSPVVVTRWDQTLAQVPDPATAQPPNPSFDIDSRGWTATTGFCSRETLDFYSAPACGKTGSEGRTVLVTAATGLDPGRLYEMRPAFNTPGGQAFCNVSVLVEDDLGNALARVAFTTSGGWELHPLRFVSPQSGSITLTIVKDTTIDPRFPAVLYFDDFRFYVGSSTVVDRRRFRRTKILKPSFKITDGSGQQLADVYLRAHRTTPFRGSCRITPGGARYVLGGSSPHPSVLLTMTQELLRLSHRIDPDTGAVGRTATIATVKYVHRDEASDIALDDPRGNFDALVARMASVQGAG